MIAAISCTPAKNQTYIQDGKGFLPTIPENTNLMSYVEKRPQYQLQAGDIISIEITSLTPSQYDFFSASANDIEFNQNPLLSGYLLDNEGYVILPHIGKVLVGGLTVVEAQEQITTVVSDYLDSPNVYIRLVSFHFTILGEVNRQGKYQIFEDRINVLEALGMGEGLTEYADFTSVRVLRTENGVSKVGELNLLQANLPTSPFYYLKPNDVVLVGQVKTKNFRRNQASNIGLFFSGIATIATVFIAFDRFRN